MKINIDKIEDIDDGSANVTFSADDNVIKLLAAFGFKQAVINAVSETSHVHMTLQQKYDLTKKALEDILDSIGQDVDELKQIAAITLDKVEPIEGIKDD